MITQRAGDQHFVARLALRATQVHAFGNGAHAARVDVHAVAVAAVHHFRVAGDQMHAGLLRAFRHGGADALEILNGEALLQHEAAAEVARHGAARGHVVHRAAHGEASDVAAREEMRRHHEAVGGERQPLARSGRGQHRRVVAAQQLVAGVRGEEHIVDDALHHRPAAAVPQHDRGIHKAPCPSRESMRTNVSRETPPVLQSRRGFPRRPRSLRFAAARASRARESEQMARSGATGSRSVDPFR